MIDAKTAKVVGTLALAGDGEQIVAGNDGLYVNLEDKNEVAVFDPKTLGIKRRMPVAPGTTPTGLAIDKATNRLFVTCRSQVMVVMDAMTGKVITTKPIGAQVDWAEFDAERRLIFVSNGDGTLNIFGEKANDQYTDEGVVYTQLSGKTMAFDAKTKRIYIPAADIENIPPTIPGTRATRKIWPNSFGILVVGQQAVRKPIFVSPEQIDAATLLPKPPAADSLQGKADLAELHKIEQTRTPAQVAHAQADDKEESIFIYKDILGAKFNREALPATALLSDHVKSDEGIMVNPAKNFFRVPRPYHRDPTLKPVCKMTDNRADYAYPSGHATTGYLEALVLSLMLPEKKDAIMVRADDYVHSRAVCGVHYPSDAGASKIIATAMVNAMKNNPQFQQELEKATVEIRKALGIPGI